MSLCWKSRRRHSAGRIAQSKLFNKKCAGIFLDSNALAVSLYPPSLSPPDTFCLHLDSSFFVVVVKRLEFSSPIVALSAPRHSTKLTCICLVDLQRGGSKEGERGESIPHCQCCPRWNVPIIRAKQTQSSPGICLNFPFLLPSRNLQSVQRASCHKHHTPTQSLTHPAPFPPSGNAGKAIRSHPKSEARKPLQVLGEAGDLKRIPCQTAIFLRISTENWADSRATCGALHTLSKDLVRAPWPRISGGFVSAGDRAMRSLPGRSLLALSSARLLSLSSLKTFKHFFFLYLKLFGDLNRKVSRELNSDLNASNCSLMSASY